MVDAFHVDDVLLVVDGLADSVGTHMGAVLAEQFPLEWTTDPRRIVDQASLAKLDKRSHRPQCTCGQSVELPHR
jgi:hypothetical protein